MSQFVREDLYVIERVIARDVPGLTFNIRNVKDKLPKSIMLGISELKELLAIHSDYEPDYDGFYRINFYDDILLFTKRNFIDIQNQLCVYSTIDPTEISLVNYCETAFR